MPTGACWVKPSCRTTPTTGSEDSWKAQTVKSTAALTPWGQRSPPRARSEQASECRRKLNLARLG